MMLRLHEIELGTANVAKSKTFYQDVLGLQPTVSEENLTVFNAGTIGLDFNTATHHLPGVTVISFITDDLETIETRLKTAGILYQGPSSSHLGMRSISFTDPDGYLIKVNTAG